MNSSQASPPIPFRSKTSPKPKTINPDPDPLTARTPDKPPQRARNRHAALSLKEVRNAALARPGLAGYRTEKTIPARRKIIGIPEKPTAGGAKSPVKYELLSEFFDSLDNSIRLLRLKGSPPYFGNLSRKIECFTDRRFTYEHLAQLKFVLPEVIELKRIMVFDERTSCMRPDLHVSMNREAVDDGGKLKSEEGGSIHLRKLFRSRLVEFSKTHPEGETSSNVQNQQPTVSSHLPMSFQRHFSQKPKSNEVDKTYKSSEVSSLPVALTKENVTSDPFISSVHETPRKDTCKSVQNRPAKLASTPARLMSATPGLCTPKRSYMSPESDNASPPNQLVRRPPRTRSLKFDSPMKTEQDLDVYGSSVDSDVLDILPKNLLQSIREKERIAMQERDPAISEAKRRRQMIACLPKTFNMIHFLFQSISRSVMTKEQLIYKLISGHFDIVDRSEVEEQVRLLLELVPDWISEKLTIAGDLLLRVDKTSSADSIRARLEEAK